MTLTHRSALALLSSFLFVSIGLSRADAVYAQETANPLYDQLGARLAIAQDSASSTQELRTFLGGLSDTELIELARQAIDKDDRLLLKRGVSRELQSRLLAGTAIDSLLETATNSSEASEVRTFAFGTLKSARRKVTPEFRRRMFSAAAGAATTAETPGETRLTALRTANRSIGLLIEEGAAEAKAVEAYGKQLEAIIVDRQEDGALRADAVRGVPGGK